MVDPCPECGYRDIYKDMEYDWGESAEEMEFIDSSPWRCQRCHAVREGVGES